MATYSGPECKKCGTTKRYLPRKREITGACVKCKLTKSAAWREANPEKQTAATLKWRAEHPEQVRELERQRQSRRQSNTDDIKKIKTRAHIQRKVNRGELDRIETLVCRRCDSQAVHYHHPDYDAAWLVIPLCRECHIKEHSAE